MSSALATPDNSPSRLEPSDNPVNGLKKKNSTAKIKLWINKVIALPYKKDEQPAPQKNEVVLVNFCLQDAGIHQIWPQIQILREISSPEPGGNVQNLNSTSENDEITILYGKKIPDFWSDFGIWYFYRLDFLGFLGVFWGWFLEDCWRRYIWCLIQFWRFRGRFFRWFFQYFFSVGCFSVVFFLVVYFFP